MDEEKFKRSIIRLKALAKQQGDRITREQVKEILGDMDDSDDVLPYVFKFLEEEKIGIISPDELKEPEDEGENAKDHPLYGLEAQDSAYVRMYLEDIAGLHELGISDRDSKLEEVLSGRADATEWIPVLFLKDVVDIARLYAGQGVFMEDLIGEGNVSLVLSSRMMDMCESVDEAKELITKHIMDSMEDHIFEHGKRINIDNEVLKRINELNDSAKELSEELGRKATIIELAEKLDITAQEIDDLIRIAGPEAFEDIELI